MSKRMKKIFYTILVFLFAVTISGNAQFFSNNENETGTKTETGGGVRDNYEGNNETGGFFRAESDDYERPDVGGGIGEVPVNDGLAILILCSIVFVAIKFYKGKK